MQIKTKRVSHALCFISLLLYPALANPQSGTAAPEGQPREDSTLGAGPASPESQDPAPAPAAARNPPPGPRAAPSVRPLEIQRLSLWVRRFRLHSRLHPELQRSG